MHSPAIFFSYIKKESFKTSFLHGYTHLTFSLYFAFEQKNCTALFKNPWICAISLQQLKILFRNETYKKSAKLMLNKWHENEIKKAYLFKIAVQNVTFLQKRCNTKFVKIHWIHQQRSK